MAAKRIRKGKHDLVFHVGNLEKPRVKRGTSLEGSGLSVSEYPHEWMAIARNLGGTIYALTKRGARFLESSERSEARALKWSIENGYLEPRVMYRYCYEDGDECEICLEFETLEEAEYELDGCWSLLGDEGIEKIEGYMLGPKGIEYWREGFRGEPDHGGVRRWAIVFYAEAQGKYDGVWWEEELDVNRYSAPRGVIFQDMLPTWKVERLQSENPRSADKPTRPDRRKSSRPRRSSERRRRLNRLLRGT